MLPGSVASGMPRRAGVIVAGAAFTLGLAFIAASPPTATAVTVSAQKATCPSADSSRNAPACLVVLGTGTPNADPERLGPALAVVVRGVPYLIDAGPGVVRRAAAAERAGISGLAPRKLGTVFITHLHSDHTVGLPDLIFTPWVLERTAPLQVYGPAGVASMVRHLELAYAEDVRVRVDGA